MILQLSALELGQHVVRVTAVDVAGNSTVEEIGFTVDTSIADVLAHLDRFEQDGSVMTRTALYVRIHISVAQLFLDMEQTPLAQHQLQLAVRAVDADVEDPAARNLLIRDLEYVIEELG